MSDTLDRKYARTLSLEKKDVRKMLEKGGNASKRYSSESFTSRNTEKIYGVPEKINDQIYVFFYISYRIGIVKNQGNSY